MFFASLRQKRLHVGLRTENNHRGCLNVHRHFQFLVVVISRVLGLSLDGIGQRFLDQLFAIKRRFRRQDEQWFGVDLPGVRAINQRHPIDRRRRRNKVLVKQFEIGRTRLLNHAAKSAEQIIFPKLSDANMNKPKRRIRYYLQILRQRLRRKPTTNEGEKQACQSDSPHGIFLREIFTVCFGTAGDHFNGSRDMISHSTTAGNSIRSNLIEIVAQVPG